VDTGKGESGMTWQIGLGLACLWLVAIYLILEFMSFAKRGGSDDWREFTEHQWKDIRRMDMRRRLEDRARKERAGIR
jgi:hypothetical protein